MLSTFSSVLLLQISFSQTGNKLPFRTPKKLAQITRSEFHWPSQVGTMWTMFTRNEALLIRSWVTKGTQQCIALL